VIWRIEYAQSVQKSVAKFDANSRKRINDFLQNRVAALDDPRQIGDTLTGPLRGCLRYRVGDYRIICRIQDDRLVVLVIQIGHRSEIYRH
jgi:mRNA interferase RelE/StbE